MAQEIASMGGQEFADSNDVHDALVHMHEIIDATQGALHQMGEQVGDMPGIIPAYAEAIAEAASSLSGIADALQSRIGQGITG
jgi:methyl-accepting chemotaxis protein